MTKRRIELSLSDEARAILSRQAEARGISRVAVTEQALRDYDRANPVPAKANSK